MYYKISINGNLVFSIEATQRSYNTALKQFKSIRKKNKGDIVRLHGIFGEVLQEK